MPSLETKYRHAISEFRRRHVTAFEKLFVEVLWLASASASGLLKVGRLALDGTKIKAFSEIASRHGLVSNRAMSYDRRQTEEVRLQNEIRERLSQAEAEDRAEDAQHGANGRGDELPAELHLRESRLKKIREAQAALEAEARAHAAAENAAREAEARGPRPCSSPHGASRAEGSTPLHRSRFEDQARVEQGLGSERQRSGAGR